MTSGWWKLKNLKRRSHNNNAWFNVFFGSTYNNITMNNTLVELQRGYTPGWSIDVYQIRPAIRDESSRVLALSRRWRLSNCSAKLATISSLRRAGRSFAVAASYALRAASRSPRSLSLWRACDGMLTASRWRLNENKKNEKNTRYRIKKDCDHI